MAQRNSGIGRAELRRAKGLWVHASHDPRGFVPRIKQVEWLDAPTLFLFSTLLPRYEPANLVHERHKLKVMIEVQKL